ncbi:MAG: hypothetical protein R3C14_21050 [Caldilineaceae bacterium]
MFPLVQGFLTKIYSRGEAIRPPAPLTFFRAFLGQLLGYTLTRMVLANSQGAYGAEAGLDEFIEIFLHGVLAEREPQGETK